MKYNQSIITFLFKSRYFLQCYLLEHECKRLTEVKDNLNQELNTVKNKYGDSEEKLLQVEASLLNAMAEVNVSIHCKKQI